MKNARIVFTVFGIAFLMFVVAPLASAENKPGFGVWTGTHLKLTTSIKGYYYSPTTFNNLNPGIIWLLLYFENILLLLPLIFTD